MEQTLRALEHEPCRLIEVEYDPALGYPRRVFTSSQVAGRPGDLSEWRLKVMPDAPGPQLFPTEQPALGEGGGS
ncbi:hypothetical protein ACFP81_06660 [Deinococcus lacus]|uniref:WYL domain-containing protein n=1 Tax=Deinococcus lacus TaxID=392561 RepID=A0ABW1YFT2_9DEIO